MFYKKSNMLAVAILLTAFILSMLFIPTSVQNAVCAPVEAVESLTQSPRLIKELDNTPISFPELYYSVYYDIDMSTEFVRNIDNSIELLNYAIDSATYTEEANAYMAQEITRLQDIKARVAFDIEKYTLWEKEHYYAAKVWEYFMQRGYGEAVTCGIIGNMMIETSGGTLNLNPSIYSYDMGYYGLCQWSLYYRPGVADLPFEYQLEYLEADMAYQFNVFGGCYKSDFDYEDFLAMKDPAEAAIAFAKAYERCGSGSYGLRKAAAEKAYTYFDLNS